MKGLQMSIVDLTPGTEFAGQYAIVRCIGSGAFATVYEAEHLLMHRRVALKILSQNVLNDKIGEKRFLTEVHAFATLDHPHIIRGFAAGVSENGFPFVVTEFIAGNDLAEILREEGKLSAERFRMIILPVIDALSCAHSKNFIHRDIKPSNILVGSEGEVKLLDFGVARIMHDQESAKSAGGESQQITKSGSLVGTPNYMSPEQITGKRISVATDIYQLGVLMYECLSGQPPFTAESDTQVLYAHLNEAVPAIQLNDHSYLRMVTRPNTRQNSLTWKISFLLPDVPMNWSEQATHTSWQYSPMNCMTKEMPELT